MPQPRTVRACTENQARCIEEAARYLATEPDAVAHALTRHRRGADGRCRGCWNHSYWPCVVIAIARRAAVLVAEHVVAAQPES